MGNIRGISHNDFNDWSRLLVDLLSYVSIETDHTRQDVDNVVGEPPEVEVPLCYVAMGRRVLHGVVGLVVCQTETGLVVRQKQRW